MSSASSAAKRGSERRRKTRVDEGDQRMHVISLARTGLEADAPFGIALLQPTER